MEPRQVTLESLILVYAEQVVQTYVSPWKRHNAVACFPPFCVGAAAVIARRMASALAVLEFEEKENIPSSSSTAARFQETAQRCLPKLLPFARSCFLQAALGC
jgi:hypothetical protein